MTLAHQLWHGLKRDLNSFWVRVAPPAPPGPGLYTYRFEPPGRTVRVHLRVEAGGRGLMFVDVTDVFHLNPTATFIAHMALEGVPITTAHAVIAAQGARETTAVDELYTVVARAADPTLGCVTCAVTDFACGDEACEPRALTTSRAALFSLEARAPFKADLALTYGCNNHCAHCYNEPGRLGMESLTLADWKRVIDRLHTVGVPHLILTGGEATLHPDLPEIIRYADGLGHVVGLNTNGRRMAHEPFARELKTAGLNHLQVTLASHRPEIHDAVNGAQAWHQTVRGIRMAQSVGIHTITNTTLMRTNMDEVEATIDFLHDLGVRTFAMNAMIYSGGGFASPEAIHEHELAPLLIRVRDHAQARGMKFLWYTPTEYCRMSPVELEIGAKRCNAAEYSICVEPNGDVLPCQSFYTNAGNVLIDPWDQIWNSDLFRSFRERELNPKLAGLPEKCWKCPDLPLCGGGCRIEREARDGIRTVGGCNGGACHGDAVGAGVEKGFIPLASLIDTSVRASGGRSVEVKTG